MNKGNYDKVKTKKFMESEGYKVEYLEKLQHIFKDGKVIYIKRDLLGADGVAYNDKSFILWNSTTKANLASHIKRFKSMGLPDFITCWVVIWTPRARQPEIVEVE